MTPRFSLRRLYDRHRYMVAQVATNPHQAVSRCVDYWISTEARGETPGMSDQLAKHGWVGTEIITGSDLRHSLISPAIEDIPIINIFPSLAPKSVKRARQEKTRIIIAARASSVGGRPASELWCFDAELVSDPSVTNAYMDTALAELTDALGRQGILLSYPRYFLSGNLPTDHVLYWRSIAIMRKAAKNEAWTGRGLFGKRS